MQQLGRQPWNDMILWKDQCRRELDYALDRKDGPPELSRQGGPFQRSLEPAYRIPMPGEQVVVAGLRNRSHLNGMRAEILDKTSDERGRMAVRIVGGEDQTRRLRIHVERLKPLLGSASESSMSWRSAGAGKHPLDALPSVRSADAGKKAPGALPSVPSQKRWRSSSGFRPLDPDTRAILDELAPDEMPAGLRHKLQAYRESNGFSEAMGRSMRSTGALSAASIRSGAGHVSASAQQGVRPPITNGTLPPPTPVRSPVTNLPSYIPQKLVK